MSIAAAASRLNVSVDSVRRRLRSGALSGVRDQRGQWWLELPDNLPLETPMPSVDQRLAVGMALPAQTTSDAVVQMLQDRIDELLQRLDLAEKERRDDKEKAAAERDRLIALIESLTRQRNLR